MDTTFKYAKNNAKLHELAAMLGLKKTEVVGFDLPAGFTCPAAYLCAAYSNRGTGKITHGKKAEFTCYAAKLEAAFPAARRAHWHNFDLIRASLSELGAAGTARIIAAELTGMRVKVVRVHTSGDFYSPEYFAMWVEIARLLPDVTFFGYSKILAYVRATRPDNFKLAYSVGGKHDAERLPTDVTSTVVMTREDAIDPVACATPTSPDDYSFIMRGESFSLVLH